ncbi:MAG: glycosyltransferase family 2 protein [Gammaproteobacteria bacterium]
MSQSTIDSKAREHSPESQPPMPAVSIGMPVYNGENFLESSLSSLLAQSFKDFELIISDNGSTDRTEAICRAYAASDPRIRYHRSEANRGAAWNFNNVAALACGEFFMWAAHDDWWAPEYVARCVETLVRNKEVILCYTAMREIDENGAIVKSISVIPQMESPKPYERFSASWRSPPHFFVFGLIRSDALRKTRLIGNFSSSDRIMAGHLALLGPFHGIRDYLFFYRKHEKQSTRQFHNRHTLRQWYDPSKRNGLSFPHWRLLREHLISIKRTPLSVTERLACYASVLRWMARHRWSLLYNLVLREAPSRPKHKDTPNHLKN